MSLTTAFCRLCAQEVPTSNIIDLAEDTTLYQEICKELSMFNDINVNVLFTDHAPKIVCQSCNASLLVARQFIQKLRFTQQIYMGNSASNNVISGLEVKIPKEVNQEVSNREFETKTNEPVPFDNLKQEHFEEIIEPGIFSELFDVEMKPDQPVEVLHTSQGNFVTNQKMDEPMIEMKSIESANDDNEKHIVIIDQEEQGTDNNCLAKHRLPRIKIEKIEVEEDTTIDLSKSDEVEEGSSVKATYSECSKTEDTYEKSKLSSNNSRPKVEKSWVSFKWSCHRCPRVCLDLKSYREHCTGYHKVCCAFKCSDCGVNIDAFELFIEHVRGHRETLRSYCEYCNIKLQPDTANSHKQEHISNEQVCPHCGDAFENLLTLKQHVDKYDPKKKKKRIRRPPPAPLQEWVIQSIEDKSWSGYEWTCRTCTTKFNNVDGLREHTRDTHNTCFDMKCVDCNHVLDCYRGFIDHVRKHRLYLKQYCHYCNHRYSGTKEESQEEKEHIAQHFAATSRQCVSCGLILPDQMQLQQHIATYNPPPPKLSTYFGLEKPLTENDLTCQICNMVLKSQYLLRKHITQKHETQHTERKKDHICDVCGKGFHHKIALRQHRSRHDTKSELCKICMNSFPNVVCLRAHVKSVHAKVSTKQFECIHCNKAFQKKGNLMTHLEVHSDALPFQCQYCEKAFKRKEYLRNHMLQHSGERPYKCPECDMRFASWGNCNKHVIRIHNKTLAKKKRTEEGVVSLDPETGRPRPEPTDEETLEWKQQVLKQGKRGPKKKYADTTTL